MGCAETRPNFESRGPAIEKKNKINSVKIMEGFENEDEDEGENILTTDIQERQLHENHLEELKHYN